MLRRFLTSHTPADATPLDDRCRYITVDRDLRDVLMSWANHRSKTQRFVIEALNDSSAADGATPLDPDWDGDLDPLFDEVMTEFTPLEHVRSWWICATSPTFCTSISTTCELTSTVRCVGSPTSSRSGYPKSHGPRSSIGVHSKRCAGRAIETIAIGFEGGADAFFHQGTNGRWDGALTDSLSARIDHELSTLPPDVAAWLQHGSIASGDRT